MEVCRPFVCKQIFQLPNKRHWFEPFAVVALCLLIVCYHCLSLVQGASILRACSPDDSGKILCTCNSEVDCRKRSPKLRQVPLEIPDNTVSLDVSHNAISTITRKHFVTLKKLVQLDLNNNRISVIEAFAFEGLNNLQIINMTNNRLKMISDRLFQHLHSITTILLEKNDIRTIEKYAFLTLTASTEPVVDIYLQDNPNFQCSCEMVSMQDWFSTVNTTTELAKVHFHGLRCANFQSKEIETLTSLEVSSCKGTKFFTTSPVCESCNLTETMELCDRQDSLNTCKNSSMCFTMHSSSSKPSVSKGCHSSNEECLRQERNNSKTCSVNERQSLSGSTCTYCCTGNKCNRQDDMSRCPAHSTNEEEGRFVWQETLHGETVTVPCPGNSTVVFAKRKCWYGIWEIPDLDNCKIPFIKSFNELKDTELTSDNVDAALRQLLLLVNGVDTMAFFDEKEILDMIEDSVILNFSRPAITTSSVINLLSVLTSAPITYYSGWYSHKERGISARILKVMDRFLASVELQSGRLECTASNLAVAVIETGQVNTSSGLMLTADYGSDRKFQQLEVNITSPLAATGRNTSSLVIPASLLSSLPKGTRIAMNVYLTDNLFQDIIQEILTTPMNWSDDSANKTKINSHVMAASVIGFKMTNLSDPVIITFVHQNKFYRNPKCVYWDTTQSMWSPYGCRLSSSNNDVTICACDHLTNFALIMDVYGTGSSMSGVHKIILSYVSYIGCSLSLLALVLTLLTYVLYIYAPSHLKRNFREQNLGQDKPTKILLNLCSALVLTNLVFLAGTHDYAFRNPIACKVVAVLLHFSLLAAFCWMAVEAVYMYLSFSVVFTKHYSHLIHKCAIFGWGMPLVIVFVTLGVNKTENYGLLSSGICWLKGKTFYIAFLAPVLVILVQNFIFFALVMRIIFGLSGTSLTKSQSISVTKQLRGCIGVIVLLGLTWILGVFAIEGASLTFQYLFAIFNTLQGFFIFLYHCVLRKNIRDFWRQSLSCFCFLDKDKDTKVICSRAAGHAHKAQDSLEISTNTTTPATPTSE